MKMISIRHGKKNGFGGRTLAHLVRFEHLYDRFKIGSKSLGERARYSMHICRFATVQSLASKESNADKMLVTKEHPDAQKSELHCHV